MHLITVFAPIHRSSIHHSKLLSSPHLFSFIASLAINSHSPSALYAFACSASLFTVSVRLTLIAMVLSQLHSQKIPQTVEMLGFVKDVVFLLVCA